jgi:hypothetical protein
MSDEDESGLNLLGAVPYILSNREMYDSQQKLKAELDRDRQLAKLSADIDRDNAAWKSSVAASGIHHCGASNMTIWHYLFFFVLFVIIFFAPRIYAYVKYRVQIRNEPKESIHSYNIRNPRGVL